jgi:hypothetical protein
MECGFMKKEKNVVGVCVKRYKENPSSCGRSVCNKHTKRLMEITVNFGDGFSLNTWLCPKCANLFRARLRDLGNKGFGFDSFKRAGGYIEYEKGIDVDKLK